MPRWTQVIGTSVLSLALLAACGGSEASSTDSTTTSTAGESSSAEGQAYVEAIVVRQAADERLSEDERRCIAVGMVDTVGLEEFEAAGVTPSSIQEGGAFLGQGGVLLTQTQAGDLALVFARCTDTFALVFGGLDEPGTLTDEQSSCLADQAERSDAFLAYLQAAIGGDDSEWFTTDGTSRAPTAAFLDMARAIYDGCEVPWPAALADAAEQPATSAGDAAPGDEQTRPVTVVGEALPPAVTGGDDPAVGTAAPRLEGQSFDGTPVVVAPGQGKLLLVFGAHWCPYCQAELQLIQQWVAGRNVPADVEVIAVSTGVEADAKNYPPSVWMRDTVGWTSAVLADDESNSAGRAYGLGSIPMLVAVGADGLVTGRHVGGQTEDQLAAFVADTLGG